MRRNIGKALFGAGALVVLLPVGVVVASGGVASARVSTSVPLSSTSHLLDAHMQATSTTGDVPPQNPSQSLAPSPNFTNDGSCTASALDDSQTCNTNVEQAIDNARATLEAMPSLSLNLGAYDAMTVPEQLFVIANLERTDRGMSPLAALTSQLDGVAQTAAAANDDPDLSSSTLTGGAIVNSWGSLWAGGTSNPLGSDYYWMYDDGPGSPNGSCTTASSAGCWGHRDNILGTFTSASCAQPAQYMGAGDTPNSGSVYGPSFTEIIVGACGPTPSDVVVTWAQAQQALESGGGTTTTTTTTTSTTTTTTAPAGATVPGAPGAVTASSSATKGVVVTWEAPALDGGSPITGYKIFRARSSGAESFYMAVPCIADACSYTNKRTRSSRVYFYTVAAVNAVGTGPASSEVSAQAR